jgi:hypothetical protein
MDSAGRSVENVEHARWRVQFIQSLIEMNRGITFHSPKRAETEAALLMKLADAEQRLAGLLAANAPTEPPSPP